MIDEKKLIEALNGTGNSLECTVTIPDEASMQEIMEITLKSYRDILFKAIDEQPKVGEWIPVSYHEANDEELKELGYAYILDCPLPEDGQEILVCNKKYTWLDICYMEDGCYLESDVDWRSIVAWQPMPEPYKVGEQE